MPNPMLTLMQNELEKNQLKCVIEVLSGVVGLRVSNHFLNSKADIYYLIEKQKKVINSQ